MNDKHSSGKIHFSASMCDFRHQFYFFLTKMSLREISLSGKKVYKVWNSCGSVCIKYAIAVVPCV